MTQSIEKLLTSRNMDDWYLGCCLLSKFSESEILEWYKNKCNRSTGNLVTLYNESYYKYSDNRFIRPMYMHMRIKKNIFIHINGKEIYIFKSKFTDETHFL